MKGIDKDIDNYYNINIYNLQDDFYYIHLQARHVGGLINQLPDGLTDAEIDRRIDRYTVSRIRQKHNDIINASWNRLDNLVNLNLTNQIKKAPISIEALLQDHDTIAQILEASDLVIQQRLSNLDIQTYLNRLYSATDTLVNKLPDKQTNDVIALSKEILQYFLPFEALTEQQKAEIYNLLDTYIPDVLTPNTRQRESSLTRGLNTLVQQQPQLFSQQEIDNLKQVLNSLVSNFLNFAYDVARGKEFGKGENKYRITTLEQFKKGVSDRLGKMISEDLAESAISLANNIKQNTTKNIVQAVGDKIAVQVVQALNPGRRTGGIRRNLEYTNVAGNTLKGNKSADYSDRFGALSDTQAIKTDANFPGVQYQIVSTVDNKILLTYSLKTTGYSQKFYKGDKWNLDLQKTHSYDISIGSAGSLGENIAATFGYGPSAENTYLAYNIMFYKDNFPDSFKTILHYLKIRQLSRMTMRRGDPYNDTTGNSMIDFSSSIVVNNTIIPIWRIIWALADPTLSEQADDRIDQMIKYSTKIDIETSISAQRRFARASDINQKINQLHLEGIINLREFLRDTGLYHQYIKTLF